MDVYKYYDSIVENELGCKHGECRVFNYDNKTIIKRFSEADENIFHVNVQNLKKYGEISFPDVYALNTTVINKANDKICVNEIIHYVKEKHPGNTRSYYAKAEYFICFSKSRVITNYYNKKFIKAISYFDNCFIRYRHNEFFKDLFLYHHPDKSWALELDEKYDCFDYRIKTISKYSSLEEFLSNEHHFKKELV